MYMCFLQIQWNDASVGTPSLHSRMPHTHYHRRFSAHFSKVDSGYSATVLCHATKMKELQVIDVWMLYYLHEFCASVQFTCRHCVCCTCMFCEWTELTCACTCRYNSIYMNIWIMWPIVTHVRTCACTLFMYMSVWISFFYLITVCAHNVLVSLTLYLLSSP